MIERGFVRGAVVQRKDGRGRGGGASPVRRRGRWRQLPLRSGARHVPRPRSGPTARPSAATGRARSRRAVDRVLPRREGPQRQPDAGLRVDLPGRRRHGEHRRRAAVDVPRLQGRQHHQPAPTSTSPPRPSYWELDPDRPRAARPVAACPMGGSVGPKAGPTHLVVGDAAGTVNPFNGEGIDYAYETGRMAAEVLHEAHPRGRPVRAAAVREAPRRRVRPVLQGGPPVRPRHRPAGADARADPGGHAEPHADGVGAADHGQPAAARRAGPGRAGLQGRRRLVRLAPDN